MKNHRLLAAFVAFGALLSLFTAGLFLLTHERVADTEPVGPSGRALRDPFWAATLLLREMQVPTEARYGLGQLPPADSGAVVIVLADNTEHRQALAARLESWVYEGGHVVFAVQPRSEFTFNWLSDAETEDSDWSAVPDALSSTFGVEAVDDGDPTWDLPTVVKLERAEDTSMGTVESIVTRSRKHVSTMHCSSVVGEAEPSRDSTDAPARFALRSSCVYPTGRVTVLSSTDFFDNTNLRDDRGDNAAFFWDTVAPNGPPSKAILVLRGDAPSFFALLWSRGWPVLVSLAVLFLGWAAWQGQRFGPVLDRPVEARRSMLEHLDAAGALMWRFQRLRGLSGAMRRAVRTRLARRSPAIAHLQGQALAEAVADVTGRPVSSILQVLVEPPPTDRQAFVEMVQTLQQIWLEASPLPTGRTT